MGRGTGHVDRYEISNQQSHGAGLAAADTTTDDSRPTLLREKPKKKSAKGRHVQQQQKNFQHKEHKQGQKKRHQITVVVPEKQRAETTIWREHATPIYSLKNMQYTAVVVSRVSYHRIPLSGFCFVFVIKVHVWSRAHAPRPRKCRGEKTPAYNRKAT